MATGTGVNLLVALKDYIDTNKCTVEYCGMSASGAPLNPTFNVKVKILAEAQAAQALIALIHQIDKISKSDIPTSESQTGSRDENCGENIIGELQVSDHLQPYVIYNV